MFDKLFGRAKRSEQQPIIDFGRYSDNNKTIEKIGRWAEADNLFKEKKHGESIDAFFDYLRDDAANNVTLTRNGTDFSFQIFQGSKIVRGSGNAKHLQAEVSLAKMPQPSVPVMRRLLEQNFSLYYSRYSLDGERLCMRFDSDIETANPNKLYYALKELATKADKQDDLLVKDFASLASLDTDHIAEIPEEEKEIKFVFVQKWINETLQYVQTLDTEKFSGGISYLLLALAFRIDYLVCPEGSLQAELERIPILYFAKDEKPVVEKNAAMAEAFEKLQAKPREEFFKSLFRNKSSFSIVAPQTQQAITDAISGASNNMTWYKDNNYPQIARQVCEYGISYCQYTYSLPRPLSELFLLLMKVNYSEYFVSLGFTEDYVDDSKNNLYPEKIKAVINSIQNVWKKKYPKLEFKTDRLNFDSMVNFNHSFTGELQGLNFDNK